MSADVAINEHSILHLILEGKDLADVGGWFGSTDPFYMVQTMVSTSSGAILWQTVFTSVHIESNLNPRWEEAEVSLQMLCKGDIDKPIRISVVDWEPGEKHNPIGTFQSTVRDLLAASGNAAMKAKVAHEDGTVNGELLVRHARIETPRTKLSRESKRQKKFQYRNKRNIDGDDVRFTLEGQNLYDIGGWFGTTDPYYQVMAYAESPTGETMWQTVFRSEHIEQSCNPIWKTAEVNLFLLCGGDLQKKIRISIFDRDENDLGKPNPMGHFETTVEELVAAATDTSKVFQVLHEGADYGKVRVIYAELPEVYTMSSSEGSIPDDWNEDEDISDTKSIATTPIGRAGLLARKSSMRSLPVRGSVRHLSRASSFRAPPQRISTHSRKSRRFDDDDDDDQSISSRRSSGSRRSSSGRHRSRHSRSLSRHSRSRHSRSRSRHSGSRRSRRSRSSHSKSALGSRSSSSGSDRSSRSGPIKRRRSGEARSDDSSHSKSSHSPAIRSKSPDNESDGSSRRSSSPAPPTSAGAMDSPDSPRRSSSPPRLASEHSTSSGGASQSSAKPRVAGLRSRIPRSISERSEQSSQSNTNTSEQDKNNSLHSNASHSQPVSSQEHGSVSDDRSSRSRSPQIQSTRAVNDSERSERSASSQSHASESVNNDSNTNESPQSFRSSHPENGSVGSSRSRSQSPQTTQDSAEHRSETSGRSESQHVPASEHGNNESSHSSSNSSSSSGLRETAPLRSTGGDSERPGPSSSPSGGASEHRKEVSMHSESSQPHRSRQPQSPRSGSDKSSHSSGSSSEGSGRSNSLEGDTSERGTSTASHPIQSRSSVGESVSSHRSDSSAVTPQSPDGSTKSGNSVPQRHQIHQSSKDSHSRSGSLSARSSRSGSPRIIPQSPNSERSRNQASTTQDDNGSMNSSSSHFQPIRSDSPCNTSDKSPSSPSPRMQTLSSSRSHSVRSRSPSNNSEISPQPRSPNPRPENPDMGSEGSSRPHSHQIGSERDLDKASSQSRPSHLSAVDSRSPHRGSEVPSHSGSRRSRSLSSGSGSDRSPTSFSRRRNRSDGAGSGISGSGSKYESGDRGSSSYRSERSHSIAEPNTDYASEFSAHHSSAHSKSAQRRIQTSYSEGSSGPAKATSRGSHLLDKSSSHKSSCSRLRRQHSQTSLPGRSLRSTREGSGSKHFRGSKSRSKHHERPGEENEAFLEGSSHRLPFSYVHVKTNDKDSIHPQSIQSGAFSHVTDDQFYASRSFAEESDTSEDSIGKSLYLKLEGRDMVNMGGWFGTTNFFYQVTALVAKSDGTVTRQTCFTSEAVENDLNPRWKEAEISFDLLCGGDNEKPIRFLLFHKEAEQKNSPMGFFDTTISTLVRASGDRTNFFTFEEDGTIFGKVCVSNAIVESPDMHQTKSLTEPSAHGKAESSSVYGKMASSNRDSVAPLTRRVDEVPRLILSFQATDVVVEKGWFGSASLSFEICASTTTPGEIIWQSVYHSETIESNLSPRWKEAEIDLGLLCGGNLEAAIRVSLFDRIDDKTHNAMGFFETTVDELLNAVQVGETEFSSKNENSFVCKDNGRVRAKLHAVKAVINSPQSIIPRESEGDRSFQGSASDFERSAAERLSQKLSRISDLSQADKESLMLELDGTQHQLKEISRGRDTLKMSLIKAKAEIAALHDLIARMKSKDGAASSSKEAAGIDSKDLLDQAALIEKSKQEKNMLLEYSKNLAQQVATLEKDLKERDELLNAANQKVEHLLAQRKKIEVDFSHCSKQLREVSTSKASLEESLFEAKAEISSLKKELVTANESVSAMQKQCQELTASLASQTNPVEAAKIGNDAEVKTGVGHEVQDVPEEQTVAIAEGAESSLKEGSENEGETSVQDPMEEEGVLPALFGGADDVEPETDEAAGRVELTETESVGLTEKVDSDEHIISKAEQSLAAKEAELKEANESISKLMVERGTLSRKVDSLEDRIVELQNEARERALAGNRAFESSLSEMSVLDRRTLETNLVEASLKLQSCQDQLMADNSRITQLSKEKEELNETLLQLKEVPDENRKRLEKAKALLSRYKSDRKKQLEQKAALAKSLKETKKTSQTHEIKLKAANKNIEKLQGSVDARNKLIEKAKHRLTVLKNERDSLQSQVREGQGGIAKKHTAGVTDHSEAGSKANKMTGMHGTLDSKLEDLESDPGYLRKELEKARAANGALETLLYGAVFELQRYYDMHVETETDLPDDENNTIEEAVLDVAGSGNLNESTVMTEVGTETPQGENVSSLPADQDKEALLSTIRYLEEDLQRANREREGAVRAKKLYESFWKDAKDELMRLHTKIKEKRQARRQNKATGTNPDIERNSRKSKPMNFTIASRRTPHSAAATGSSGGQDEPSGDGGFVRRVREIVSARHSEPREEGANREMQAKKEIKTDPVEDGSHSISTSGYEEKDTATEEDAVSRRVREVVSARKKEAPEEGTDTEVEPNTVNTVRKRTSSGRITFSMAGSPPAAAAATTTTTTTTDEPASSYAKRQAAASFPKPSSPRKGGGVFLAMRRTSQDQGNGSRSESNGLGWGDTEKPWEQPFTVSRAMNIISKPNV